MIRVVEDELLQLRTDHPRAQSASNDPRSMAIIVIMRCIFGHSGYMRKIIIIIFFDRRDYSQVKEDTIQSKQQGCLCGVGNCLESEDDQAGEKSGDLQN